MKPIQIVIAAPVSTSMEILLRPKASWRKKYSDKMSVMTAIKKGSMYFLLILIKTVE
jgi:hypothetical protein